MRFDDGDYQEGGKASGSDEASPLLIPAQTLSLPLCTMTHPALGGLDQLRSDQLRSQAVLPEGHICGAG